MYKQKSGPMMRAGYDKNAENPFRTEEMMKLREGVQKLKKGKLSGYEPTYRTTSGGLTIETPAEKSVAADVLGSQKEKFKSGPSLINKDQTTSLYSPDPVKKAEMQEGRFREGGGLGRYIVTQLGRDDDDKNLLYGPSQQGFEAFTQDKKTGRFKTSIASKAMGRLDKFFREGKF